MPLDQKLLQLAKDRIKLELVEHHRRLNKNIEKAVNAAHRRRNPAGILSSVFGLCEEATKDWVDIVRNNLLDVVEKARVDYSEDLENELKSFVEGQLPESVYAGMIERYSKRATGIAPINMEHGLFQMRGTRELALRKAYAEIDLFIVSLSGKAKAEKKSDAAIQSSRGLPFVESSRIDELRRITDSRFDLTKLVKLCEELNVSSNHSCFFSIATLTRTIIDHVPPIFGLKNFSEVADNYRGTKSFKESMQHLDKSSRTIANTHLHTQIRNKEVLPSFTQVNFSTDLDVLLAEIIRILK